MAEPHLDNFLTQVAINALHRKKPDLLLLHLIDVDDHKHRFGSQSEQAKEALRRQDERLGLLITAIKECWTEDEYSVIVFSDHGCLPVHTAVEPNDFLKKYHLIRSPESNACDFDAYFHNAGGTAFLKILEPSKKDLALRAISEIKSEPFFKRKLTDAEMKISGMSKDYFCGLEAADGYCFGEFHYGQHGYSLNHENYHTFYLAAGNGVDSGKTFTGGCIVDICPLAAELLGIPAWEMDGIKRI
jgi:hypothetical protein